MSEAEGEIYPPFSPPDCPWVSVKPGDTITEKAVNLGGTLNGENVYIGRVFDDGFYLNGSVLRSTGECLYLSKKGEVKSTKTFDVLTTDVVQPLAFRPMALDQDRLLFVSGGSSDGCLYCARVTDGENTYIGWADKETKKVHIPRKESDGPNQLDSNYDILIHTLLDRLCICPPCPRPPPF